MNLYRFRLIPESPWRTPWQSDTLAGLLCWMCARTEGDSVLQQGIIEPALAGRPPFVLSDAFPGDWLPLPTAVRLLDAPAEQRKTIKRAKWLSRQTFGRLQRGELPVMSELIHHSGIREYTQLRNTINRLSNTTTDGSLFPTEESVLDKDVNCLTVFARVETAFIEPFWRLVQELTHWGFGSDRSAGKGQFHLDSQLEPANELDAPADADGCVVLSTFQPATSDPTDGAWEAFTKYGKLGPDFGLENVFKRPVILFRPGACFRCQAARGWMGRTIPMHELLAEDAVGHLNGRAASVVHWAFGLCVPLHWPRGILGRPEPATKDHAESMQPSLAESQSLQRPPRAGQDPDKVTVKVLERRDIGGNVQFFVQEEGKPRGVLAYGVPPSADKLPQVGDILAVYRNNRDPRNPQYRWDKAISHQDKPKGGPGSQRPRGRR
jgi:CRISPR-associated protein Csm4